MRAILLLALLLPAGWSRGEVPDPASRLRAGYAAMREATVDNAFRRPMYLRSRESAGGVAGEVYALLDYPYALAGPALAGPAGWCEILLLHFNTKYCRPSFEAADTVLHVGIGTKHDQALADAYPLAFTWRVSARNESYLAVTLGAGEGPLDTRDYRIVLEAAPTEAGRTIMRLSYAYAYGPLGRFAMQVYLATVGRDKVGFTIAGRDADGNPALVGGLRGVVERNAMRYFLAIDAILAAPARPALARREAAQRTWFAATERHPRQLHEMAIADYLEMKRREFARQLAKDEPAAR